MSRRRQKRRALKFAVRTRLNRHIQSMGFERPHTKAVRGRWPEFLPDCTHGRMRGETTDFLDIYWDKYGGAKFKFFVASGPTRSLYRSTWMDYAFADLQSGHYGLPWGLLGFGGVWFGAGQSADDAVDLAIRRLSEWDDILKRADMKALAALQKRGFLERTGPASWWLRHVRTDVPQGVFAFYDWIFRITGAARP